MNSLDPATLKGRIHSCESGGMVDGPGIRFVVFTQGCPLRCLYCHNPDTQSLWEGREISVDDLMLEIVKYRSYMRYTGGGMTITGGEPLIQHDFCREIFRRCKELGIHTALDTSGFASLKVAAEVLDYVDLTLLCIKAFEPELHTRVTGVPREPTLKFARYLNEIDKRTWIRFVVVPGLTDAPDNVAGLAQFLSGMKNIEKIEILPFHKMGEYKWERMGVDYELKDTPTPTPEQLQNVAATFRRYRLTVDI
ncbi:MAG TPA: pyruvate formate-lyase-activating protein [Rhodocyclaceae bacterium]|nr:pyruvate formate-lyase-activating protein [Rhodocyclaceae bacterium]